MHIKELVLTPIVFQVSILLYTMATKVYLVTGASRGLGLEFITQLQRTGHTVIAAARNPESSEGLQKLVDNKQVFSIALDTVDTKSIDAAVHTVNKIAPNGIDVSYISWQHGVLQHKANLAYNRFSLTMLALAATAQRHH